MSYLEPQRFLLMNMVLQKKPPPEQPNEEDIPPGTYLSSCNGCKFVEGGSKLFCQNCPKTCGTFVEAEVSISESCRSVSNENGKLVCEIPPEDLEHLPRGTYLGSCSGCTLENLGTILRCLSCRDTRGQSQASELNVSSCSSVGNKNGKLECQASSAIPARKLQEEGGDIPAGLYRDSCSGCTYKRYNEELFVLQCLACRTDQGVTVPSEMFMYNPCSVVNQNGKLSCELPSSGSGSTAEDGGEMAGIRINVKSNDGSIDTVVYDERKVAEGWRKDADGFYKDTTTHGNAGHNGDAQEGNTVPAHASVTREL